jgi:integrase
VAEFEKLTDGIGRYTLIDGTVRWRVVYKVDGKTRSKGGFATKGAALHWQRHTLVSVDRGEFVPPERKRLAFGAFADEWLESARLRPSTRTVYAYMLRRDLATWRDVPLGKITPAKVRAWRRELETRPAANGRGTLSDATVQKAYRLLKRILNVAVEDGHLNANPCREKFEAEPVQLHCPTPAEVQAIAEAIEPRYSALVLVVGFGGLRWGEAIALRRGSVSVPNGCIEIAEQAVEMADGKLHVSDYLKSAAGRRTVYLPRFVMDSLALHLSQWAEPGRDGLVFPAPRPVGRKAAHDRSRYLRRSNFRRRAWLPALDAAGVPAFRFHDLRHGAATLLAQRGATTAEVMAQIGHSTPRAALRYQHAQPERMQALVASLDDLAPERENVVSLRPRQ